MPITVDMSQTIWGIELFEQGELKGEAAILQRQLERRFGKLPNWAVERIEHNWKRGVCGSWMLMIWKAY